MPGQNRIGVLWQRYSPEWRGQVLLYPGRHCHDCYMPRQNHRIGVL